MGEHVKRFSHFKGPLELMPECGLPLQARYLYRRLGLATRRKGAKSARARTPRSAGMRLRSVEPAAGGEQRGSCPSNYLRGQAADKVSMPLRQRRPLRERNCNLPSSVMIARLIWRPAPKPRALRRGETVRANV